MVRWGKINFLFIRMQFTNVHLTCHLHLFALFLFLHSLYRCSQFPAVVLYLGPQSIFGYDLGRIPSIQQVGQVQSWHYVSS